MNKFMKNMKNKKKKGFTLVELIIVIAIIAVLAAMAIPKLGAIIIDSKISKDIATAKNIQTGVASLIADGTYGPTVSAFDPDSVTAIEDKVDGTLLPTAKNNTDKYSVEITGGNVIVKAGGVQLAPANDGTKAAYKTYVTAP